MRQQAPQRPASCTYTGPEATVVVATTAAVTGSMGLSSMAPEAPPAVHNVADTGARGGQKGVATVVRMAPVYNDAVVIATVVLAPI